MLQSRCVKKEHKQYMLSVEALVIQSFKFISEHHNKLNNLLARPQINARTPIKRPGEYIKSSGLDPTFKRGQRLIGARRLIEKIA